MSGAGRDALKEHTLESEPVFEGALLKVWRDRVELPSHTRYRLVGVGLGGFRDRDASQPQPQPELFSR